VGQQLYFNELDWSFTNTCDIEVTAKKLSTINNFKCLLKQLGVIEPSLQVNLGGAEWASIKNFFSIRDRITHPSDPAHLSINEAEIAQSDIGRKWVTDLIVAFNNMVLKKLPS